MRGLRKPPQCPKCHKELTRKYPRRQIWECKEHGMYKLTLKRPNRPKFDPNDSTTWRATCAECGNRNMKYHNYKYYCPNNRCGNILYV